MRQSLIRLREALAIEDWSEVEDAVNALSVDLVLDRQGAGEVYAAVLGHLKALPQPQSRVGGLLVNLFQFNWDHVPPDVLADARAFCEVASADFVDAGAYQAMIELASGEWPGHRASDA
jgi:hypothetical protein